jgi:hypothetical protein
MTYEQELQRLYDLLVATDDQCRVVLEAAEREGTRYYDELGQLEQVAGGINHETYRLRDVIHTREAAD